MQDKVVEIFYTCRPHWQKLSWLSLTPKLYLTLPFLDRSLLEMMGVDQTYFERLQNSQG